MSQAIARANGRRSKVRSFVEHMFARQKAQMKLFIRTIGIARGGHASSADPIAARRQ